jgi:general stress protein 26
MEPENIGLYLTLYSKPYYTRVLNIVKELEELQSGSKIYIYGCFVDGILKQSYGSSYNPPDCVELWFHTNKSVNSLKRVKINDIYFKIVNNDNKPIDEVYINTSGEITVECQS